MSMPKSVVKIPEVKMIVKKLKLSMNKIAKERDKLRELMYEVEMIKDVSDEAVYNLEAAIDNLSQYM
jgi:DNA-dependent RNA polymerase auxiliary subunit epsilon